MALLLTKRSKTIIFNIQNLIPSKIGKPKFMSHYPVDDSIFGLNEDQQQVKNFI